MTKEDFIPIVAFAGTATLKIKSKQPVVYFSGIKKIFMQYQDKKFSEDEILKLAETISSGKMDSSISKKWKAVNHWLLSGYLENLELVLGNLEIAKTVPFSRTNDQLKEYTFSDRSADRDKIDIYHANPSQEEEGLLYKFFGSRGNYDK